MTSSLLHHRKTTSQDFSILGPSQSLSGYGSATVAKYESYSRLVVRI